MFAKTKTILRKRNALFGVYRNRHYIKSELCYKGIILQRIYRKIAKHGHVFLLFMVKRFGSHNIILLYSNLGLNKICYKGQGSYRQVSVKFKDFSRTTKSFLPFSRTENL